jgi:hypothetical protein
LLKINKSVLGHGSLLITVFLQIPIIPNLVGVVGVHWRSEFQTWYRMVMRDDAASAYVLCLSELPLSQFTRGWISRLRQMREAELVKNLSRYSNW